jgi:long-subunit fatty acid transport protein
MVSRSFAVSEAAVLSLMISPGARAAGMGEAFVSVSDDATATYWNPAGLAFQTGSEITLMHCNWLPTMVSDMFYEFLAYRQNVPSLGGTIGGNITYFNMGEQVWTDENYGETHQERGTFHSWDLAVTLSYATKLKANLGLGVNMRYIHSALAPSIGAGAEKGTGVGSSFAADLGILYNPGFLKGFSMGLNLSNMGPKITYIDADQADPLPTNLKVGIGFKVLDSEFNKLRIAFDTNKLLVVRHKDEKGTSDPFYKAIFTSWSDGSLSEQSNRLISSIGAEYGYNNMIFLRGGYYYDPDGHVKYPTFGAGLQYYKFRLDFAYVAANQDSPLSDTMRFSLTAGF